MAQARKLPSGAYRTQANKKIGNKLVRKSFTVHPDSCGGSWQQAKNLSELMAREWLSKSNYEENHSTVRNAIDLYIKDRSSVLSPSTIADYKNMYKHFEDLLEMDVNEIDSKILQNKINNFAFDGLAPGTVRNRMRFLTTCLDFAGVEKRFKLRYPKAIPPKLAPPEPSEFHRLLSMASPEEKLTIVLAGLYTLRRGEIAGLCGEDLLWDLHSIYVHTSRVQNDKKEWIRRDMPKNLNSVRVIQIDPEIMDLFPRVGPKEYVISLNPNQITKHFDRLRSKACVSCRFHDLRKFAASIRSEMMPSKYVEADGGWRKGSQILSSIYDKPFVEKRNEYSKKFNKAVVKEYGEELFGG